MVVHKQTPTPPHQARAHCQHEFFALLVTRDLGHRKPSTRDEHGCVEWFDYCKHPVEQERRGGKQ